MGEKMNRLTHVDRSGAAHMVDVTSKTSTLREARASGAVVMKPSTLGLIRDNAAAKGDVLGVARVAGVMAAKRTSELIPLCHGLTLTGAEVSFQVDESGSRVEITATVRTEGKTGVEMEAMTAVCVAALTIYDMCKAVDRGMIIEAVRLDHKSGGRSGSWSREP